MSKYLEYELTEDGIKYIRYPANDATRLVVVFSAKVAGFAYNRLHHFWFNGQWTDTEYVFFCEEDRPTWYMHYDQIVDRVISRFEKNNVAFIGSSMGAFAALYHGARTQVGSILATALQAPPMAFPGDFDPATQSDYWPSLQSKFMDCNPLPKLYIESSGHWSDQIIFKGLFQIYMQKGGKIIAEFAPDQPKHTGLALRYPDFTIRAINFLREWNDEPS